MDKGRQQYSRNQRYNTRNCYQQNTKYAPMNYVDNSYDCGCNKPMNDCMCNQNRTCEATDCPMTSRDALGCMPLGMGYVPWQQFENLYEECEAVYHGTIFCDLDLDFLGMRCE